MSDPEHLESTLRDPGARVLLLTCDDLGLDRGVNAAVVRAVEEGVARSCSLMVAAPAADHAVRLLRDRPGIAVGVHLTLVCESQAPWGPVAPAGRVPSLLDGGGLLHVPARRRELLAAARLDEIEIEFRAQLDAVLAAGLSPTHLDWHCLADGGRDDVFDLTLSLADEHGLAVRAWLPHGRRAVRRRGLPTIDHDFLDSFRLTTGDRVARCVELLRALPPGFTEWAMHPGTDDADRRHADPDGWLVRSEDLDVLTSPLVRQVVADEGIVLVGYREVQQAWARARPRPG